MSIDNHRHPDHLLFLHIQKTAGSTTHNIIERQYRKSEIFNIYHAVKGLEQFNALTTQDITKLKIIKGHFAFGIEQRLPGSYEYITILRDPVDRVISHYYHAFEEKNHWHYNELHRRKLTFEDVLDEGTLPNLENNMVRMLSGNNRIPFGSCTREMLDKANDNLEKHFAVIGLQSRFDEFIIECAERYGWRNFLWYRKHRVGKTRPKKESVNGSVLEKIHKCTVLDQELYDRWKPVIEKRISDKGAEFAERVARFKKNNSRINKYFGWWPKSLTP
jgi:Sulfotransferase family